MSTLQKRRITSIAKCASNSLSSTNRELNFFEFLTLGRKQTDSRRALGSEPLILNYSLTLN